MSARVMSAATAWSGWPPALKSVVRFQSNILFSIGKQRQRQRRAHRRDRQDARRSGRTSR